METGVRGVISEEIRKTINPVAKARELLVEEYRKTAGVYDVRVEVTAAFELRRSLIVQAVYERMSIEGDTRAWLAAGELDIEREEAEEMRGHRMKDGIGFFLKNVPDDMFDQQDKTRLCALDEQMLSYKRFLGSYRTYVPGVGYAISVRKRALENQDSFLVYGDGERRLFSVADGCGSELFSAIASHMCVRELAKRNGISKTDLVRINDIIAWSMNPSKFVEANGKGLGSSTIVLGISNREGRKMLKVGDSIGFASHEGVVEELARDHELRNVIGYHGLTEEQVEFYGVSGGQFILTSDGVTNYCPDTDFLLAKITAITTDPVIIAERLLRSVLVNQAKWGHADDVTIVVEEKAA